MSAARLAAGNDRHATKRCKQLCLAHLTSFRMMLARLHAHSNQFVRHGQPSYMQHRQQGNRTTALWDQCRDSTLHACHSAVCMTVAVICASNHTVILATTAACLPACMPAAAYPYAIAMRNNEHPLPRLDSRCNAIMPKRQDPFDCVLKGLSQGHFCFLHCVPWPITNKTGGLSIVINCRTHPHQKLLLCKALWRLGMHSICRVQVQLGIVIGCISEMHIHSCWDTEI